MNQRHCEATEHEFEKCKGGNTKIGSFSSAKEKVGWVLIDCPNAPAFDVAGIFSAAKETKWEATLSAAAST